MFELAPAVLFATFIWWFSTGAVLLIDGLPRRTYGRSLGLLGLVAAGALYGLAATSHEASLPAAYLSFTFALLVWGWHELSFLTGAVTGPRKVACPPDARGWQRFRLATLAVLHHEIALAATLLLILALTWGGTNQVGTATFSVLWVMRLSAKLNVFLGVRNISQEFIPEHLQYLRTYFRSARLNPLMPVSIVGTSAFVLWLLGLALAPEASAFAVCGMTLVATMLALAVLEHLFMALPLSDAILWRWALRPDRGES